MLHLSHIFKNTQLKSSFFFLMFFLIHFLLVFLKIITPQLFLNNFLRSSCFWVAFNIFSGHPSYSLSSDCVALFCIECASRIWDGWTHTLLLENGAIMAFCNFLVLLCHSFFLIFWALKSQTFIIEKSYDTPLLTVCFFSILWPHTYPLCSILHVLYW